MQAHAITIQVTPEAADVYESASEAERRKLDALVSLRLTEARQTSRPIEEIMREASAEARERGLTEDILNEILSER
jgi:hypothetical protein